MQIITTHKNTDFDALASMMAATILYPDAIAVLPKNVNPNVKAFLSIHKNVFKTCSVDTIDLNKVKRLVVVDTNNWNRLDRMEALMKRDDIEILLWDHHTNKGNIESTWKCQKEMGATITLIALQLKKEKKDFTVMQATLFLAGLYEDTGHMTFPSLKSDDAYAAAYLLEQKADLNVLNSFLAPSYGKKQKKILFEMLDSASITTIDGYSVSFNKLIVKGHVGGLATVVRMCREILNVNAVFGIFWNKDKNKCMVIGRSNIDGINLKNIMHKLGGGGHPGAGSAVIDSIEPNTVENTIKKIIQGRQTSSITIGDIMSSPVFTADPDVSMEEVALILRKKGCTGIPIVRDGKVMGIISRKDFRRIKQESKLKSPVRAFMSANVVTIPSERSPMQAAALMAKYDIGRLPITQDDKIVGIITRSNIMAYFYDHLPT